MSDRLTTTNSKSEVVVVWPFSKSKKPSGFPQKLPFKSGADFLEYQCKYGHTKIVPKLGIFALVLDTKMEFGTAEAVKMDPSGVQTATLKVASQDGGFMVSAQTPSGMGDRLKPGDVVIWVPFQHIGDAVPEGIDRRSGWVGFIVAKAAPEIDMSEPDLGVTCRYA